MIRHICTHCKSEIESQDTRAGSVENCPTCGDPNRVPGDPPVVRRRKAELPGREWLLTIASILFLAGGSIAVGFGVADVGTSLRAADRGNSVRGEETVIDFEQSMAETRREVEAAQSRSEGILPIAWGVLMLAIAAVLYGLGKVAENANRTQFYLSMLNKELSRRGGED